MPSSLTHIQLNLEGMMSSVGLNGDVHWTQDDASLVASVVMSRDDVSEEEAKSRIERFTERIFQPGAVPGVTFQSSSERHDTGIMYTLQVVADQSLEQARISGTLDELVELLSKSFEYELRKRRPKRKKDELPDPGKGPKASVNRYPRSTKQFKTDVSPRISDRVDAFREATGMSKREITEAALEAYLDAFELK